MSYFKPPVSDAQETEIIFRDDNQLVQFLDIATRAFDRSSSTPTRRAKEVINEYGNALTNDISQLKKIGEENGIESDTVIETYIGCFKHRFMRWMRSQKMVQFREIYVRSRITPAQEQLRYDTAKYRKGYLDKWRSLFIEAFRDNGYGVDVFYPELIDELIVEREADIIRKKTVSATQESLIKLKTKALNRLWKDDLNDAEIIACVREIKKLSDEFKVAQTERREVTSAILRKAKRITGIKSRRELVLSGIIRLFPIEDVAGVLAVENYIFDCIYLLFDYVPDREIISRLKECGWRWYPKYSAWRRHRFEKTWDNIPYVVGLTDFNSYIKQNRDLAYELKVIENNRNREDISAINERHKDLLEQMELETIEKAKNMIIQKSKRTDNPSSNETIPPFGSI